MFLSAIAYVQSESAYRDSRRFSAILDFLFVKTTSIVGKTRNVLASRNTDNDACAPHNIKAAFLHFSPQKLGIGDWSRTYN